MKRTMSPRGDTGEHPGPFLEIACFNVQSALAATEAGADRIELCAGADVGGTTPTLEDLKFLKNSVSVPVNVMIRPRGGNFIYTEVELAQMKQDIERFKPLVDGFVFGVLDEENQVDVARNGELLKTAVPRPCTFHRAFDEASELVEVVGEIADLGFAAILTSGGEPNAVLGAGKLKALVEISQSKIKIIVGGGVRSSNIENLIETTQAEWFHSSALVDESSIAEKGEIRRLLERLRK